MRKDPIVEEVRSVRREIEKRYPDAASFYEHLEQYQQAYRGRLVRREPQKTPQSPAS